MYSQFFGSYLLRRDAITPEQLTHAISQLSAAHIKLGTLAMHKGYMVVSSLDNVWSMMVPFPMRNCKRWSWTTKPKMRCMTSI